MFEILKKNILSEFAKQTSFFIEKKEIGSLVDQTILIPNLNGGYYVSVEDERYSFINGYYFFKEGFVRVGEEKYFTGTFENIEFNIHNIEIIEDTQLTFAEKGYACSLRELSQDSFEKTHDGVQCITRYTLEFAIKKDILKNLSDLDIKECLIQSCASVDCVRNNVEIQSTEKQFFEVEQFFLYKLFYNKKTVYNRI